MSVFVIQNTSGLFLNKESQWAACETGNEMFFSPHRDVALNQLLEVNTHDVFLRAKVVERPTDARGRPLIDTTGQTREILSTDIENGSAEDNSDIKKVSAA